MKTSSLTFLLILLFCHQGNGQTPDSLKFKSLIPTDFNLKLQKQEKAILIDVRESFEYRKSRLKDAVNIPSSGNLEITADTLNKDYALFFYCTTGFRSKRVAKFFCNKGFTRVYSLDGGIVAWRKSHMPVDKKRIRYRE